MWDLPIPFVDESVAKVFRERVVFPPYVADRFQKRPLQHSASFEADGLLEFARPFRVLAELAKTRPIAEEVFEALLLGRREDRGGGKRQPGRVSETIAELHLFFGTNMVVVVKTPPNAPYSVTKL